jgi:hypothetical protein
LASFAMPLTCAMRSHLTLALSGRLTRFQARGRRNMAGAPDARPR